MILQPTDPSIPEAQPGRSRRDDHQFPHLPVGATGHHVDLRAEPGVADRTTWRCGNCDAEAERETALAIAEAAVHAAHCDRRGSQPLPAGYLDTLEDAATQRIAEYVHGILLGDSTDAQTLRRHHLLLTHQARENRALRDTHARLKGEHTITARTANTLAVLLVAAVALIAFLP